MTCRAASASAAVPVEWLVANVGPAAQQPQCRTLSRREHGSGVAGVARRRAVHRGCGLARGLELAPPSVSRRHRDERAPSISGRCTHDGIGIGIGLI